MQKKLLKILVFFSFIGFIVSQTFESTTEKENNIIIENAKKSEEKAIQAVENQDEKKGEVDEFGSTTAKEKTKGQAGVYTDGNITYATSATKFQLMSKDDLSTLDFIEYKINGSAYKRYQNPIELKKEGKYFIVYRGVDKVGNREAESTYTIIIDNTAPAVAVVDEKNFFIKGYAKYVPKNTKIELKATDNSSGLKNIEYKFFNCEDKKVVEAQKKNTDDFSVNNSDKTVAENKTKDLDNVKDEEKTQEASDNKQEQEFQVYKDVIELKEAGEYCINYRAVDYLGNKSEELLLKVKVDDKAPIVKIIPAQEFIVVNTKKFVRTENLFTIEATDVDSGVKTILVKKDDDKDFVPYVNGMNFTVEGTHTIEAIAIDNVGNKSDIVKLNFIVDNHPPKTVIKLITK